MNSYLFFTHTLVLLSFLLFALYLGKEALMLFVSTCTLFANFFVTKEILLFGFEVTASDVYTIGAMLAFNSIQEYFGKSVAQKALWISFFVLLFGAASSFLHLAYEPSPHDRMHPSYAAILSPAPRLALASLATFFITQYLDIHLFSFFKQKLALPFFMRAGISCACVMVADTTLFSFLGLYGLVHSLFDIVIISLAIKLFITAITSPFLAFSQLILHKKAAT